MKILFSIIFLFGIIGGHAQDTARHITFTKVEVEAQYPGGPAAWTRFLNKNLHYPQSAPDVSGTVIVRFIVDADGNVSDIQAISGPTQGGLREEVMRVIRLSGKWIPATQNGHKVRSYKKIPIEILLQEE